MVYVGGLVYKPRKAHSIEEARFAEYTFPKMDCNWLSPMMVPSFHPQMTHASSIPFTAPKCDLKYWAIIGAHVGHLFKSVCADNQSC